MLKFLEKAFDKIRDVYGPRHFPALVALLVVISAAGLFIGAKYSRFIRQDPEYCNSCHLMQQTYANWRGSTHKTVTCQDCHRLGVIEQNALLVKHILYGEGKKSQKHGKALPWTTCGECHWEQTAQGAGRPEESHGHHRHAFLECFNCHPFGNHDFPADASACARCHQTKEVHGVGMEGLACVDCHIFSLREGTEKNRVIPTRERCLGCHRDMPDASFPGDAPMASLECFACHNPHGSIKPDDALCMACHEKDVRDRGHAAHAAKGPSCAGCHRPHTWGVSPARALCSGCHAYREGQLALFKQ